MNPCWNTNCSEFFLLWLQWNIRKHKICNISSILILVRFPLIQFLFLFFFWSPHFVVPYNSILNKHHLRHRHDNSINFCAWENFKWFRNSFCCAQIGKNFFLRLQFVSSLNGTTRLLSVLLRSGSVAICCPDGQLGKHSNVKNCQSF
jgi:hypothetical protein